ncbi:MAG: glycoside hydrolase family protein [Planctomycetota bacterium]
MYRNNSFRLRQLAVQLFVLTAIFCAGVLNAGYTDDAFVKASERQELVEQTQFIQIPGPNPIIRTGPKGAWDEVMLEASDAIRDVDTYYFYYHAIGRGNENEENEPGYQVGVASSNHPLGPFKKHGDGPVLKVGPKGSWDGGDVACAMVLRDGDEDEPQYYMWYSGGSSHEGDEWSIGLATASHPLGPWKKYEGNPVLKDFGYVGGVVKVDGKYRLYSAYPISWRGYKGDYSPLAVALADRPEGPWEKYEGNPLMRKGNKGDWDDGGISEAEVLFHNGMYHMFYGGTEYHGPRVESVGYAYSFDGFKWYKYGRNPVAKRQANPNAAAFAEVHAIIEPPFVYVYHTLRPEYHNGDDYPWVEDLGVQVLVTERPFSLDMPVLNLEALEPGQTTTLADSPPICLGYIKKAALTIECSYTKKARIPIRMYVRASSDGVNYDTANLLSFDNDFKPGETARKTFDLNTKARFIKVLVENLDESESVSDVKVIASLSG